MITILTRTMPGREQELERLRSSIDITDYTHIVYCDERRQEEKAPYDWNLFCNNMKDQVAGGYFVFADDDDYFMRGALKQLEWYLAQRQPQGVIVQYRRGLHSKPPMYMFTEKIIKDGFIGGGCLVLHARHAGLSDWDGAMRADFRWIRSVAAKIKLDWYPIVLQITGNNGRHGR